MKARFLLSTALAVAALSLSACGGGGGSSGDVRPRDNPILATIIGPDSFLLFPNPQVLPDGTLETNSQAYAEAYYAAVDPNNDKDTLEKWKFANGFTTSVGGPEAAGNVKATFGDVRDLGYGRELTMRRNTDGTVAAWVRNYSVNAGDAYGYSAINLDAAVARDTSWHVGTNAIEFSPGPNGGASFTKFYTFTPSSGARLLAANLDRRGNKAMPGICINCHGGRADPLTPASTLFGNRPLFNLVQNSVSMHRGDVQARMQMLHVDSLAFSPQAGYTRTDLEPILKSMNQMVLCTYPLAGAATGPEDACRPAAGQHEWQGPAANEIKLAYGGDGLPGAAFSDTYIPNSWIVAGQTNLYRDVVKEACITCHRLRGTGNQSDISFIDYAKFLEYAPRIKAHVFDRGNMPLARIVAEKFWSSNQATIMADWLQGLGYTVRDGSGALLRPGRPIADAGPNRVVSFAPVTLSAANSLYADSYSWSIVSNPGGAATLSNPNSAAPVFTASANGTYQLQLIASKGGVQSEPAGLTLVVNNALAPAPSAVRFADIKNVLQTVGCTTCHSAAAVGAKAPLFYDNYDRNGDGLVDTTDDSWMVKEVRGRVNFKDIVASPLLRKPSGNHHNGLTQPGFNAALTPGDAGRVNYDLFLNWISNGAPE